MTRTLARFGFFLVSPILSALMLPLLVFAWFVLSILFYLIEGTHQTWLRAKRDPRYNNLWWVGP